MKSVPPHRIEAALDAAERAFGVDRGTIESRRRPNVVVEARHAVYRALWRAGHGYSAVARALRRTHGSARNGVDRAGELMEIDPDYRYRATVVEEAVR